ncbi:MAG: hypothetical protein HYT80_08965 [Euryarchaeota archaeon]|nr:hypothetical protein [Euryarchaeota archaeon]
MRRAILVGAFVLVAACASQPAPVAGSVELPPAGVGFFEINLRGAAGSTASYDWSTTPTTTVHFDVHTHRGNRVDYLENGTFAARRGSVAFPENGTYSLLWQNPEAHPALLRYEVVGDFTLLSMQRP